MKTLTLLSILSFSFLFVTINAQAGGVDSSSSNLKTAEAAFHKISDFSFRLDLSQILKDSESTDLSDLTNPVDKKPVKKMDQPLPFAFKLDAKQLQKETEQSDMDELN